jgi:hypothetical protein
MSTLPTHHIRDKSIGQKMDKSRRIQRGEYKEENTKRIFFQNTSSLAEMESQLPFEKTSQCNPAN